jgi:hypothetical protein
MAAGAMPVFRVVQDVTQPCPQSILFGHRSTMPETKHAQVLQPRFDLVLFLPVGQAKLYTHSQQKCRMERTGGISRLSLIALGICCALTSRGQIASISGQVLGNDGGPLSNAVIRIDRTDIGTHRIITTDNTGRYAVGGLPPGDYDITLEVNGKYERARSIRLGPEAVAVNFSLESQPLGPRERRLRTALRDVESPDRLRAERALKTVLDMADHKDAAAMFVVGKWNEEGYIVAKDPDKGLALLSQSAEKNFGSALYEMGRRYKAGDRVRRDEAKGVEWIRRAAILGSVQAQYYLGMSYELGDASFPREDARARQYFRMCALRGEGMCAYRMALSLLKAESRTEHDFLEALAWVGVAAEKHVEGAAAVWERERPLLTAIQAQWVVQLKDRYNHQPN